MAKRAKHAEDAAPSDNATTDKRVLEDYLSELVQIRATGAAVEETSFYPALINLFNTVGRTLKPKVRCHLNPRNQGAGIPDGGLYTADQFQRQSSDEPKSGQLPSRGALEAKGTKHDVHEIAAGEQVVRYLSTYGIVLVTNLRGFVIVDRGPQGRPTTRESFELTADEREFWRQAAHPRAMAAKHGAPFLEFIKRACLHAAPLGRPKDLAWFLASYARDALDRVEKQKELPALQAVRAALEEALGMKFTDEKGEHFFRSTLVQTLFYGVFSAWVRWHRDHPAAGGKFDWRTAEWSLHVPFVRALYEEVAKPSRLGPLGLVELLDWAASALNRVVRGEFFQSFEDEHAVQYFYEPFLEAYDPELRKELGVWYTPREIVKYQVSRVDTVLREELGLADGLADPNVVVLDPCCGTGAYLVEVLRSIAETLRDKGGDALVASDLKEAAMNRVFGFEIMPAPFVVSHLQLGLTLQSAGVPLAENERVGVYLTNALTGWEPPKGVKQRMIWTELQEERDAADLVKRGRRILVVLGNPPYNGFAGVAVDEERGLVTAYRETRRVPAPEGQGLNDLYVRFFRMAERRIAEMTGQGIVCFISNYSWLDGRSHNGMRERLLDAFDIAWVDSLNGDKYRTGKLTPDGQPDPSVFSTPFRREGIQVGTAIALLARRPKHGTSATVFFREFWGKSKLSELAKCAQMAAQKRYRRLRPEKDAQCFFVPSSGAGLYRKWPSLEEILPVGYPGVQSKQDALVIDVDRERLETRIRDYFDPDISDSELASRHPGAMDGSNACEPTSTRAYLLTRGIRREFFVPYLYKPFDRRWIYWEPETALLGRKSPEFFPQVRRGNCFVEARRRESVSTWARGAVTTILADNFGNGFSNFFPLYVYRRGATNGDLFDSSVTTAKALNLSDAGKEYLSQCGANRGEAVFFHIVAMMNAPLFRAENARSLRQGWPRIPLPVSREALEASARLGEQLATLLDTEAAVPGVTSGNISPLLKTIAVITKSGGGGALNPAAGDLAVTVGWAHRGQDGVTMPAKGRVENRDYNDSEREALAAEAAARGTAVDDLRALLGATTYDVFLNDRAYWRNVPANVWGYTIGGYQVMKKWLSYREHEILGRDLKPDEAREVTSMARRIAAILLVQPQLDVNYTRIKETAFDWPSVCGLPTKSTE